MRQPLLIQACLQAAKRNCSVYEAVAIDSKGEYLDGGKTYKVTLPKPIPAANFWSFMVYSGRHRSILETGQKAGGVDKQKP